MHASSLSVLRTLGPLLAKKWLADGTIADYDNPRQYTLTQQPISSIHELHALLLRLQKDPRSCLIRGAPRSPIEPGQRVLRNLDVFEDAPSHLCMVDVDNFTGSINEFIASLPECFQDVSCVWQLSGSHGHPSKAGKLRAHVWFWLDRPLSCEDMEAWAKAYLPAADCTVHRTVQVNYTASPVMEPGVVDPVAERLGLIEGLLGDTVILPPTMPVPAAETRRTKRAERASSMVDPREKPGVIGALARAFPAAEIVTLFPEHFEAGSKEHRITWLQGGGAKEGVAVADNGTHLFNTHSTSPIGDRAVNLFDFVRHHVFGHLDEGIDAEVLELDVTAAPSYQAAITWATSLPEVQAELGGEHAEAAAEARADAKTERATSEEHVERLTKYLALIAKQPTRQKLEGLCRQIAKDKELSEADCNDLIEAVRKRCSAVGSKQPKDTIAGWLRAARADTFGFPCVDDKGNPKPVIENLEVLVHKLGYEIRQNEILKRQEIVIPDTAYEQGNIENASISRLLSECAKVGITTSMQLVKAYTTEIAARNTYNPVVEWIGSKPWDGVSRFEALANTLVLKEGFDPKLRMLMLRKWCLQAVAAASSERPLSTRGVLTLSGPQYLGKSRWLKSLLPGVEHLGMFGKQLDPHNKDSVKVAISHWLCELGELDGVLRRSDAEAMKNFLSLDMDVFRLPYAPAETRFQRRTVFTASVNSEAVLVDDSGNTRFWVLPVVRVELDHGIDMQQLWAEALHCWQAGEAHYFDPAEMKQVEVATEQFQVGGGIGDKVAAAFPWIEAADGNPNVVWQQRLGIWIAEKCGYPKMTQGEATKLGSRVKKLSGRESQHTRVGALYWVPRWASDVEAEAEIEGL